MDAISLANLMASGLGSQDKDSGFFKYSKTHKTNDELNLWDKHFYKKGFYTDGFDSYGICKKIKKSLLK